MVKLTSNKLKNTESIWLPQVPEHWELVKVRHLFKESTKKGFPNETLLVASQEHGVVSKDAYGKRTVEATKDLQNLKLVEHGDFVISLRSFQGGIEVAHERGIISPAYTVLKETRQIEKRYFKNLFKSPPFISLMTICVKGIREGQNIDYPTFKNEYLPFPPLEEQKVISAYLDKKNNEIDKFIRNKERLIELLEEEKINVFERLTRIGENENAQVKFTGIEWIGNINQKWELRKVSHSFKKIGSGTTPTSGANEYYDNGVYPWVNTGDLNDNILSSVNTLITKKALKDYSTLKQYPIGTLLIAMYGATIGKVSIMNLEACTNQACCALVPYKYFDTEFLFYWFKGNRDKIIALSYGGGQPNISQDVIRALRIPCPKIDEQKHLVKQISFEETRLNLIISKAKQEISSIKEYRQALITDLVTGKRSVPQLQMR